MNTPDPIRAARRAAAPFAHVQRLHYERARLAAHLAEIDRELRTAEETASKALGFKVRVRGVQLLSAIERMGHG